MALLVALSATACGGRSASSTAASGSGSSSSSAQESGERVEGLLTTLEDTSFTILTQEEEEITFSVDEELSAQLAEDCWVEVEYTSNGEERTAQAVTDVSSITYEGTVTDATMNTLTLETETGDLLSFTTAIAQNDLTEGLVVGMTVAVTCPFGYEPEGETAGLAIQISQLESSSSGAESTPSAESTSAAA